MTEAQTTLLQALQEAYRALNAADDVMCGVTHSPAHVELLEAATVSVGALIYELQHGELARQTPHLAGRSL